MCLSSPHMADIRPRRLRRLSHWAVRLSAFKNSVKHNKSSEKCLADALTRVNYVSDLPSTKEWSLNYRCPCFPVPRRNIRWTILQAPIIADFCKGKLVGKYALKDHILCCSANVDRKLKLVLPASLVDLFFFQLSSIASWRQFRSLQD